jgi:NAD(P)-dependent dehydrogenase (short-subunit alcohol dehydrogenase family)
VTGSGGRLDGRTALITGAASGIGQGVAQRFLAEGALVTAADIDGEKLAAAFPAGAERLRTVAGDVADPAGAARMADAAAGPSGSLDILVNCAGIVMYTNFLELPLAEWQRVQDVNATGTFLVGQAVARRMTAMPRPPDRTRAIINIASIEAMIVLASSGHPQVHYNASKGAVLMITRALAIELAAHGIRVNSICPGLIETPMSAYALSDPEKRTRIQAQIPLGRIGRPADIAAAALFLASEESSYVTGEALIVDGGYIVQ